MSAEVTHSEGFAREPVRAWPPASSPAAALGRRRASRPVRWFIIPVALTTFVAAAVFDAPGRPLQPIITGFAFALFLLALSGPALVLAPVLATEFTTYNFPIQAAGMNQRYVVVFLATALVMPLIVKRLRFGDRWLRRVLIPALLLMMIATAINSSTSDSAYTNQYLRYQVIQVLALILGACLIRKRDDLLVVGRIALGVALLTSLASIWQHYDWAGAPFGATTPGEARFFDGRSVGLAHSPVALATQLILVLPPIAGLLLCRYWRRLGPKLLMLGAAMMILAAIMFTLTRSAIFAMAPGLAMMAWYVRGYRRIYILAFLVAAVAFFILAEGTGLFGRRLYKDVEQDRSASSHEALWRVGVAVAFDRGLTGIGHEHFEEVSLNYVDEAQQDDTTNGVQAIGIDRPHNDFLSVWISWGIAALLAYIAIFVGTLRNLRVAARSPDPLIRGLAVGSAGGVTIYAVNSTFHNSMDNSLVLWLYAGFSVALAHLATGAIARRSRRRTSGTSILPN